MSTYPIVIFTGLVVKIAAVLAGVIAIATLIPSAKIDFVYGIIQAVQVPLEAFGLDWVVSFDQPAVTSKLLLHLSWGPLLVVTA